MSVLANCGVDGQRARRALVRYIEHKQDKGRNTQHILAKVQDIEAQFLDDETLLRAFIGARLETEMPVPRYLWDRLALANAVNNP